MTHKKTFCPRLWDEVFISKNGDVFSCCHKKPAALGNIHQTDLRDICNSRIIQGLRESSLSGRLGCYRKCSILRRDKALEAKGCRIDYRGLRRLKLSFSDACNINCLMCRRRAFDNVSLEFGLLKKRIDLAHFESLEIQGGEPLFIRAAKEFFDYAVSLGKKPSFLTNGTLIDDKWAIKIAAHSSFIYFSINAATKETHEYINRGSKWELVLDNIRKVGEARKSLSSGLKIVGHMTIVPKNVAEVPLFIRGFRELGFDKINFGYDWKVPFYLKCHPLVARRIGFEVRREMGRAQVPEEVRSYHLRLLGIA